MKRLAIDVGGTWLRYELVGDEEFCGKLSSREKGLQEFLEEAMEKHPDIDRIAVSYAGQVHEGSILSAPNIEVDEPDLADWAQARYGIELILENDLNCAALAESVYWEEPHLLALYSGTGLGSGIVEKGEICHGFRSLVGEVGHIPFREAPFACGCGKRNCVELYASGSGMAKWRELLQCPETDLAAMKESENPKCRSIYERYIKGLLHAAATLVTLCNPRTLVLGGGVIEHNPDVVEEVRTRIGDYALAASLEGLRIEGTRIQNASLEGAKILLQ